MASKKLNLNLNFLDNPKPDSKPEEPVVKSEYSGSSEGKKGRFNWKSGLITAGAIILFSVVANAASNTSGTSSSSSNSNGVTAGASDTVMVGQYKCSRSNSNRLDSMRPSDLEAAAVKNQETQVTYKLNELNSLKRQIDFSYVDEYSQWSVDNYNNLVNSYNSKRLIYNAELGRYNQALSSYNSKVDAYNNFLQSSCSRN